MNPEDLNSLVLDTWRDLQRPQILWQWLAIALCFAVGWLMSWAIKRNLWRRAQRYIDRDPDRNAERLRNRYGGVHRIIRPACVWICLYVAQHVLVSQRQPAHLVNVLSVLVAATFGIYLGLYALRRVFRPGESLLLAERWFGMLMWLVVALHVLGFLPDVISTLNGPELTFTIGKTVRVSAWQFLTGAFWVVVTLVAALWASSVLESRLMATESIDGSMRIVFARFGKAILVILAVLVSMRLVGIDLTVLSVFGGALGVGLGLGLQRIASNYVSGFIILLDRSLRIGDVITIDKYSGSVTQIRTRCTVVRAPSGVEALVPNELLLNQAVQNYSYGDKNGNATTRVRVAYDSDVDRALGILLDAANAQARVLKDPAATAFLRDFGVDGIELELTFWVPDPDVGVDGTRSDINRAIWSAFKAAGIGVPMPRRDVTLHEATTERAAVPGAPAAAVARLASS